ncbi:MAG: SH3 domain-containing protein [Chloroflexi bacterium]|nr:SH3 domain-containing protein [Chloroflexota bacterium]
MNMRIFRALLYASMLAACSANKAAPIRSDAAKTPTVAIVYMTPTAAPTLVPTVARYQPTATLDRPVQSKPSALEAANCELALETQFEVASNRCLEGPGGYFCSGGRPPMVEPEGGDLGEPGALAEAATIDSLRSPPFEGTRGGGLIWLRLEEDLLVNALLIGDARIKNRTPADSVTPKWRSFTVVSGDAPSDCATAPQIGALVLQSVYGRSAILNINGVEAEINGTLIVLTQGDSARFIAIEGQISLGAYGQSVNLKVGQQLNLQYSDGDWTKPAQLPGSPVLLVFDLIEHLPITLFDRPLPIPQPGYAQTQGGVNMRAAPDINSRLLFQVPAGETMSVLGNSSDRQWLHIRLGNGETGWMSAELLARNLGEIGPVYDLTPAPPQRLGVYAELATVNVAAGGNLRDAPDTAFRVKRGLPFGMRVKLLARSPYSPWVKVNADGDIGWMALFTLTTRAVISSLPIDHEVPLPPIAQAAPTATPPSSFFSYGGGHAYPDPESGY